MACPKGWEALTPLRRARPRHARRCCATRAASCAPASLGRGARRVRRRASRRSGATHGPQSVAFLGTGQMPDRGAGVPRRAREVRHGDGARRRQHAPVHGDRRRRLQAGVRLRRAALHLRRLRGVRRARARRLEPVHRPPDHVGARLHATRTSPRSSSSIRARPRPRWRRRSTWRCARSRTCALFYGLANLLIARGWIDRDVHRRAHQRLRRRSRRTSAASRRSASPRRPACRRRRSSALADDDPRAASACRSGGRWASTRATRACALAQAIINLALMTGNIGRPGTGANSITGQCNAMGSRLFSNTTNLLGGHDFAKRRAPRQGRRRARHRRGAHPARGRAGPTTRSSRASCAGKIHGLWIVATNTAHSWINQADAARGARPARLPGRAGHVRDDRDRRSTRDLVLPAAGWGEKEGTFINSERRYRAAQEGGARARARRWPTSTSSG